MIKKTQILHLYVYKIQYFIINDLNKYSKEIVFNCKTPKILTILIIIMIFHSSLFRFVFSYRC